MNFVCLVIVDIPKKKIVVKYNAFIINYNHSFTVMFLNMVRL